MYYHNLPMEIEFNNIYNLYYIFFDSSLKRSEEILEEYIYFAIEKGDYTFETGLLGAGWFISFLVNQDLITLDVDEVLFDLDDNLYKIAIKLIVTDKIAINELLSFIAYYKERIKNSINNHNFFRSFGNHEIMKMLIHRLGTWMNEISSQSTTLPLTKAILILSSLFQDGFNESEIDVVFYDKIEFLIRQFESKIISFNEIDLESLYYLLFSARLYRNPCWIKKIEGLISKNITESTRVKKLKIINSFFLREEHSQAIYLLQNKKFGDLSVFCSINLFSTIKPY